MLNMLQGRPVSETNTNMATSDRALLDRLKWQQPQQGSYSTLSNLCYANDSYLVASSVDQQNRPATIGSYEKDKEEEKQQQLNNHHTVLGSSSLQKESTSASKKRKADIFHSGKVGRTSHGMEGSTKEKILIKGDKGDTVLVARPEVENRQSNNNDEKKQASSESSKENSIALAPMQDYIHVRARRGQATDRHSLAERARREKIRERMKFLQDLVPGCNNITGKASMLDEIINYVQSLQKQVEFLSMKLANVIPSLEFNIDEFFSKEIDPVWSTICPPAGMPCEPVDLSYLPFNNLQQAVVARGGLDVALDHPELALRRTMSAPAAVPEAFMDSCYSVNGTSVTWDTNMRSCYDMLIHQGLEFPLEDL